MPTGDKTSLHGFGDVGQETTTHNSRVIGGSHNRTRDIGARGEVLSFDWNSGEPVTTKILETLLNKYYLEFLQREKISSRLMLAIKEGLKKSPEEVLAFDPVRVLGDKEIRKDRLISGLCNLIKFEQDSHIDMATIRPNDIAFFIKSAGESGTGQLKVDQERIRRVLGENRYDLLSAIDLTDLFLKSWDLPHLRENMKLYEAWLLKTSPEKRQESLAKIMQAAKKDFKGLNTYVRGQEFFETFTKAAEIDHQLYHDINFLPLFLDVGGRDASQIAVVNRKMAILRDIVKGSSDPTQLAKNIFSSFVYEKDGKKYFDPFSYEKAGKALEHIVQCQGKQIPWGAAVPAEEIIHMEDGENLVCRKFIESWADSLKGKMTQEQLQPFVDRLFSIPKGKYIPTEDPRSFQETELLVRRYAHTLETILDRAGEGRAILDLREMPEHLRENGIIKRTLWERKDVVKAEEVASHPDGRTCRRGLLARFGFKS